MSRSVPNINRVAVIVEPKEPYLLWARNLDDDEPSIDSMSREDLTSVYLIEYNDDLERPLKCHWKWIFDEKMNSWWRIPEQWPRKRTYQMFREWFDIRLVDLVFDLVDGPIVHDEVL